MQKVKVEDLPRDRKEELQDIKVIFEKIWNNIPLFIRFYFVSTLVLYLLNIPFKEISYYLINIPNLTVFHFQIWRLFTSCFITTNIFQIIISFFVWVKNASSLEIELGTIKYILVFFINAVFIQIININLILFASLINKDIFELSKKAQHNSGLWGIIMCEMTLLCISNPETPIKLLLLPFTVKAKIYPIILTLLFIVSNYMEIDVEIISGTIYGLIYFYFLKSKLQLSDSFTQRLESSPALKWLYNCRGFISFTHIGNGLPMSITNLSIVDNEQEKEKLKKKVVVVDMAPPKEKEIKEEETKKQIDTTNTVIEQSVK